MSKKRKKLLHTIVCDRCGNEFLTSSVQIKLSGLSIDGTYIEASHFRCPYCKKSYVIQIMDQTCSNMRDEFLKQKARVQANVGRNNDQEVVSAQYVSMVAKQKRYAERCKMLEEKYLERVSIALDTPNKKQS